jgi:hypothetical protein
MGEKDGTIKTWEKVVDNGPANRRWNMVFIGDGYRDSELPQYHMDVNTFVSRLQATEPFGDLWGAINVYRLDVASKDSGAYNPAACPDTTPGGTPKPATYFDSSFCHEGLGRVLMADTDLTHKVVAEHVPVPHAHAIMLIVNATNAGGSGPWDQRVAVFSRAGYWFPETGQHEMGHTVFNLADEYPYWAGCDVDEPQHYKYTDTVEPNHPNITLSTDRTGHKWESLIDPGTHMPTLAHPHRPAEPTPCNECPPIPPKDTSPFAPGTVGTFEGAAYYRCGIYRPEFGCRMLIQSEPFCQVCQQRIRRELEWYLGNLPQTSVFLPVIGAQIRKLIRRIFGWDPGNIPGPPNIGPPGPVAMFVAAVVVLALLVRALRRRGRL